MCGLDVFACARCIYLLYYCIYRRRQRRRECAGRADHLLSYLICALKQPNAVYTCLEIELLECMLNFLRNHHREIPLAETASPKRRRTRSVRIGNCRSSLTKHPHRLCSRNVQVMSTCVKSASYCPRSFRDVYASTRRT